MSPGLLKHPAFLALVFCVTLTLWLLTRKDDRRYFGYGLVLVLVGVGAYTALGLLQTGAESEHPATGASSTIIISPPPTATGPSVGFDDARNSALAERSASPVGLESGDYWRQTDAVGEHPSTGTSWTIVVKPPPTQDEQAE